MNTKYAIYLPTTNAVWALLSFNERCFIEQIQFYNNLCVIRSKKS